MYPEIFKIGPLTVYSYGLMLVIAFFVSTYLTRAQAKKSGIDPGIIFNFCFTVFVWGVIGARIFYCLENFDYYRQNLIEVVMLQRGGLSWFGGLISATIIGPLYLKRRNIPVYKTLDLLVPFIALAQAIGRIGCLLNGCCFGKVSAYGIYFPAHERILVPVQIISVLLLLVIFARLRILQETKHKDGVIFFLYLFLYSLKRFFVEFLRADNPAVILNLTLFQVLSLLVFIYSIYMLIRIRTQKN